MRGRTAVTVMSEDVQKGQKSGEQAGTAHKKKIRSV